MCRHPNIVQIDNYFSDGDLPCIAMEYVAGEKLLKWVEKRGFMSESEALNYIRKVGEALTIVHEKGLLHRDIKPENIMVRDNQDAVLIDFGLARGFIPNRTQQITVELTQGFAPPEQYGRFGNFAQYTDVYALAATLYYLLTKTSPTGADLRGLKHPLKSPLQINSCISDEVNEAILQGMEMDAIKRPQSVQEWLAMLPQPPIRNERPKGVVPPTIPSPQPASQPVKLISAKGVDYRKLDRLLASGEWKEADEETARVMFKAAGREKQGCLSTESIEKFPCEDLRTIDQLWVKYSNGHFGFSVRKHIYQSLGGTSEYNVEVCERLGDRVGWRQKNEWLTYKDITFSETAPEAHLPCLVHHFFIRESTTSSPPAGAWVGKWVVSLLSRRDL